MRVDARRDIGSGHLVRSLALGQTLLNGGASVTVLGRVDSGPLRDKLHLLGLKLHPLPKAINEEELDAEFTGKVLHEGRYNVLILDRPGYAADWQRIAMTRKARLIVIDDRPTEFHQADVLISSAAWPSEGNPLAGFAPDEAITLAGPNFLPLPVEFANAQIWKKPVKRLKIGVFFGASDPGGQLLTCIESAKRLRQDIFSFEAISGDLNPERDSIVEWASSLPNFRIRSFVGNMAEFWARCHIGIGSYGMSAWERCAVGLPSIASIQSQDQVHDAEFLSSRGAAVNIGPSNEITGNLLASSISALASDPDKLESMSAAALRLSLDREESVRTTLSKILDNVEV